MSSSLSFTINQKKKETRIYLVSSAYTLVFGWLALCKKKKQIALYKFFFHSSWRFATFVGLSGRKLDNVLLIYSDFC